MSATRDVLPSSSSNGSSSSSSSGSDLYGRLDAAGKIVSERLSQDDKMATVDLDSMQNGGAVSNPADFLLAPNPSWQPFSLARSLPIPEAVRQQLEGMPQGARLLMGLFPELECGWFTVHNRLILWDYVNGSSFLTYEVEDSILALALAPPKPGHFVPEIKHLLVFATPLKIQLVGVAVTSSPPAASSGQRAASGSGSASNTIGFYLTDLECSTSGIPFHLIQPSAQGRIFAAAEDDGHLYEIDYHVGSGWFRSASCTLKNLTGASWSSSLVPWIGRSHSDPIIRITIDSSRHFLYTMTRSCVLQLYSLGYDGTSQPTLLAKLSDPFSSASLLLPNNPMLDPRNFEIVNIAALTAKESTQYGLVAVTSTGVRLFFMTIQPLGGRPCLRVAHVRTPPPSASTMPRPMVSSYSGQQQQLQDPKQPQQQQQQQQQQPSLRPDGSLPTSSAHSASYSPGGVFIIAHGLDGMEPDTLVMLTPDASRLSQLNFNAPPGLAELAGVMPIDGNARAMVEVGASPASPSASVMNELVSQIVSPKRAFLVVTTQSLNILVKNRPIDILANVLSKAGENTQDVQNFFNMFGREQSSAMCLALLAGPSATSALASKEVAQSLPIYATKEVSSEAIHWARRAFFELAGKPAFVPGGAPNSESLPDGRSIYFSGRHESLALHLSRLLRPVWRSNITQKTPTPVAPDRQDSTFPASFLSAILKDLTSLKTLVDNQMELLVAAPDQWSGAADRDALQIEHASLAALHSLLVQSIEAFSFIILLIDHQLPNVLSTCPQELQSQVLALKYQELLTGQNGREVARRIVSAIINLQISRGQSVDAVSETLQQRCGSFCSPDDVYLHKAADNLRRAQDQPAERRELLHESLQLLMQAAGQISLSRLQQLGTDFKSLDYPAAAVDLALHCASVWDSDGKGLAWWNEGRSESDSRKANFARRQECYKTITDLLETVEATMEQSASQQNQSKVQHAQFQKQAIFQRAFASKDAPFHFHMYDWLMEKRRTDELLSVQSNFVESYLMRDSPSLDRYDLLWQYYVRTSQYFKAAQVLSTLASSTELGLDLAKRLEYLSLAASNARSQFPAASGRHETQELLREAEDRLDVAAIQVDIQRRISTLADIEDEQKDELIAQLDEQLFSVTDLYSTFAAPFQFYDILLQILYVSDYRDPALTLEIWDGLMDKTMEDAPPEAQLDALEATVGEMARRFFPSDSVFPMIDIMTRLEKINFDYGPNARSGWVTRTLHMGNIPFDAIFESLDELFQSKTPPWHTSAAVSFLATEGILLLEAWFEEVQTYYARSNTLSFPVGDIMAAGDRYAQSLQPTSEVKAKWGRLAVKIGQRM